MQPSSQPFPFSNRCTVVFATHEYAPFHGGTATYVRETAIAAQSLGEAVSVWTVNYGQVPTTIESSGAVPVVRLSSNGRLTPRGLLGLAWNFWRRREELLDVPIVLMSVGAQMAFFVLFALGARVGGRTTCVFHGSEILRFTRNPFWNRLARRFYRHRASGFAVTTPYVETLLRNSALLPKKAPVLIAPCALPSTFHVEQKSVIAVTPTNSREPLRILTVARLHPRKGQLEVARALALLSEEWRRKIVYQIVGAGAESYRQQVADACHAGGVKCEFTGAVNDAKLSEIYAAATVYAQASRTLAQSVEGFGLTFLEAGAHGCPIAAWRSGGVASAVQDGETGLLVDEGDVAGLAKFIERLLVDPALRNKLGENGRKYARSFSWEQTAKSLCAPASA